jgi:release factor glutamine methyltransferase
MPSPTSVATRLRAAGCVFAEQEAELLLSTATTPAELHAMVARRAEGHPLEHVLGWAELCGLRFTVHDSVFVPRRRSELLVQRAAQLWQAARKSEPDGMRRSPVVVDLCCGSGALGAALVTALGEGELYAADLDPAAARCARGNVAQVGGQVFEGDLYDALPRTLRGRVDLLLANVPYVPTEEIALLPTEARVHEPRMALDGGPDGLDGLRRVSAGALDWLTPGGHVLFEVSERQAPYALDAVAAHGLTPGVDRCDELNAVVVTGTRPAVGGPAAGR